jgi:UDP-3-O-[3-hydroxymyristoyl] glucosamine N-acyltransferase
LRQIKITEAAEFLKGSIEGDREATFNYVSKIDQGIAGSITFLANPKYEEFVYSTAASIIIVPENFEVKNKLTASLIRMNNPYLGFCNILNHYFNPYQDKTGIEDGALVSDGVTIGKSVYIGANSYISESCDIADDVKIFPNCYIGQNVKIGRGSVLYPNCTVYFDCELGENVIIHSGVIIGSDGFGHAPAADGTYIKIPQIGNVVIGNNVEIGSNSTIDRATMGSTIIEEGVRIDNLVQVAHNVRIKKHTVIAAQVGVSGSTTIGSYSQVGGQAGFAGHIEVANKSNIAARTGVISNIEQEGQTLAGMPPLPIRDYFRTRAYMHKLPETEKRIRVLESQLRDLQKILELKDGK